MGKAGKTFTVFLVVFFLILLALTTIVIFFFVKEREFRLNAEQQLALSQEARRQLEDQYKSAKEEIVILTSRMAEQEDKIGSLLDDLELEKGLKEEIKRENASLKGQMDTVSSERKKFQDEVITLRERNVFLENEMNAARELRDQLSTKLQESEAKLKELEEKISAQGGISLERIIITPDGIAESSTPLADHAQGQVLKINEENNFAIIDMGSSSGLAEGMIVEFYRQEILLGQGIIARVQNIMSVADFLAPLTAKKVQPSDRVVLAQ